MGFFDFGKKKLPFQFRLYISGESQHIRKVIYCIEAVLEEKIKGLYNLMIVNILMEPDLAKADHVISTPMLLMIKPEAGHKIFGQLYIAESVRKELAFLDELKERVKPPKES